MASLSFCIVVLDTKILSAFNFTIFYRYHWARQYFSSTQPSYDCVRASSSLSCPASETCLRGGRIQGQLHPPHTFKTIPQPLKQAVSSSEVSVQPLVAALQIFFNAFLSWLLLVLSPLTSMQYQHQCLKNFSRFRNKWLLVALPIYPYTSAH